MATIQVPPAVGSSGQFLDAIVITSSTNRQVVVVGDATSTGNLIAVNASGQLTVVQAATVRSLSSGTVTLSSATALSSGIVSPSSNWTVVLSSATSLSSGTVTFSSAPAVVSASSGLIQLTSAIAISSGTVTLSSATSLSSGTVTLSSATSLSSGTVTLSSTPTVQNTSSGSVGTLPSTSVTMSIFNFTASSSASIQGVAAGAHTLYGWNFGSIATVPTCVRVYNTTAPTVGSTTNLLFAIPIPGTTGALGAGNNMTLPGNGVNCTGGIGFTVVDSFITTSTALGTHNAGEVVGQLYYV